MKMPSAKFLPSAQCAKRFARTELLIHIRTHAKVECSICHKMVSKKSIASQGIHFDCDLCNFSCKAKHTLKRHIARSHLIKKLVKDSKCSEDSSDFTLFENHQLKHSSSATSAHASAVKKFQCDKCKKAFEYLTKLKRHKQQVHSERLQAARLSGLQFN